MSDLVPFTFEGHSVRTGGDPDNPWFVAKDVCDILEISNPRDAIASLDNDEKGVAKTDTLGGKQELAIVYESGLYALIFKSRKDAAKRFRKWVTSEVLPAIRKTGSYTAHGTEAIVEVRKFAETAERILSLGNGMEARDEILIKDFMRTRLLLSGPGGATSPTEFLTIPERCVHLGYPKPKRGEDMKIGKKIAQFYRAKHGKNPPKQTQWVDGRACPVNSYTTEDADCVDRGIKAFFSEKQSGN